MIYSASSDYCETQTHGGEYLEPFRAFVATLASLFAIEASDIIRCDVVRDPKHNAITRTDFGQVHVNASINLTGQDAEKGEVGDWILENGNVDLIGRYFNPKIRSAKLVLKKK